GEPQPGGPQPGGPQPAHERLEPRDASRPGQGATSAFARGPLRRGPLWRRPLWGRPLWGRPLWGRIAPEVESIGAGAVPAGPLEPPHPLEAAGLHVEGLRIEQAVRDVHVLDDPEHDAVPADLQGTPVPALEVDLADGQPWGPHRRARQRR